MNDKEDLTVPLWIFRASLLTLVFLAGCVLSNWNVLPLHLINRGAKATYNVISELLHPYPEIIEKKLYKGEGVTINDKDKTNAGLTVLQGWFSDGVQLKLVDMNGHLVHKWPIDFFKIWPNPTHISPKHNTPNTRYGFQSQGMVVLPNGSIVASIENLGTFKMDKCGNILWTVNRMTHHAITHAKNGGYWIPAVKDYNKIKDEVLLSNLTREHLSQSKGQYEDLLLFVNEDGKVVKEFSVLKSLIDAGFERQLADGIYLNPYDPTHTNNVVEVTANLANKIKGVNEGDLLVSIRQLHMLAIFDVNTGKIKWHQIGPWINQHHPQVTKEGNISVFNNRKFEIFISNEPRGSNILEFDPVSKTTKRLYPLVEENDPSKPRGAFFSHIMGTQQHLENGNLLITESMQGRVFEVTPEGEVVWEYLQSYDKEYAAVIDIAERFDNHYFKIENWSCS